MKPSFVASIFDAQFSLDQDLLEMMCLTASFVIGFQVFAVLLRAPKAWGWGDSWSAMLPCFSTRGALGPQKSSCAASLEEEQEEEEDASLACSSSLCDQEECENVDGSAAFTRRGDGWQALLESYGAFGATPGTWSLTATVSKVDDSQQDRVSPMLEQRDRGDESWKILLNSYGVFPAKGSPLSENTKDDDDEASTRATSEGEAEAGPTDDASSIGTHTGNDHRCDRRGGAESWKSLLDSYGVFGAPPGAWTTPCEHIQEEEEEEGEECSAEEEEQAQEELPSADWKKLLDSYSVFGASPGIWSSPRPQQENAVVEADFEEEEHAIPCTDRSQVHRLFESYNLFGAAPGSWASPSVREAEFIDEDDLDDDISVESLPDERAKVLSIFESYNLFGAAPGAWTVTANGSEELDEDCEEEEDDARSMNDQHQARALFESYGLFGAAPGTWTSRPVVASAPQEEATVSDLSDDSEFDGDDVEYERSVEQGETHKAHHMLFESYGLFGATLGTWISPSAKLEDSESESASDVSFEGEAEPQGRHGKSDSTNNSSRSSAFQLLEQYGLLGAAPGTWTLACI